MTLARNHMICNHPNLSQQRTRALYGSRPSYNVDIELAKLVEQLPASCSITSRSILTPLRPVAWLQHLTYAGYDNKPALQRLLYILVHGASIGYSGDRSIARACKNLPTAYAACAEVEADIAKEVQAGRKAGPYTDMPYSNLKCSPLGSVAKRGSSKTRVVHHLSWPKNTQQSINANIGAEQVHVDLGSFDRAIEHVVTAGSGCMLAKIDIKSAYRCIPVAPADWPLLGFTWNGQYYFDTCLPFGLSSSCKIWELFASHAHWLLHYELSIKQCVHYIDDYLLVSSSKQQGQLQLKAALKLFEQLGLPVALDKLEGPCTQLVFLGIQIDTQSMKMSLDETRINDLKLMLVQWEKKTTASKNELQSLIGILNFATKIIRPGRTFTRRLIDHMVTVPDDKHQHALPAYVQPDLHWWQTWLEHWNGQRHIHDKHWTRAVDMHLYTDACTTGYGAVIGNEWIAGTWSEHDAVHHPRSEARRQYARQGITELAVCRVDIRSSLVQDEPHISYRLHARDDGRPQAHVALQAADELDSHTRILGCYS